MTFSTRDVRDVSDLVSVKLEWYLNVERRELQFDTRGFYRTTPFMHPYDVMHRLSEMDSTASRSQHHKRGSDTSGGKVDRETHRPKTQEKVKTELGRTEDSVAKNSLESFRSHTKERETEKTTPIKVKIVANSRCVVSTKEAERLSKNANKIFSELPLDKLLVIHRYRPNSCSFPPIVENGLMQNYTCHVGSALHAKSYVVYYMKEGLQTGKQEYSKRLQRLKSPKKKTDLEQDDKESPEHEAKEDVPPQR